MELETVFTIAQVTWELTLVAIFTAILCTIWQVGTQQWKKRKK